MTANEALEYLHREIHTTVAATIDEEGLPVICAIDVMDVDGQGLYFLTAKGKGFYKRLKRQGYLALTGTHGKDTLSCVAVSVRGSVRELGDGRLPQLLEKNPYMKQIYPTEGSRQALSVFQLYQGEIQWFDLSQKPIQRFSFAFGQGAAKQEDYAITAACTGCRACQKVCPQNCIDFTQKPPMIRQENCLHCGNCMEICPQDAVIWEGLR